MTRITAFIIVLQLLFASVFGLGRNNTAVAVEISRNVFAVSAYQLTALIQNQCYNPLTHNLDQKTDKAGMPYVWPATSYIEMLSDAYRLFPGDLRLRIYYRDALKKLLPRYLAADQTLNTPSGAVSGVSYYNANAGTAGDYYYDDNEWVCIQLLLGYRNLRDDSLLSAAEENLAFLRTGWDDAAGGGIYWSSAYNSKNACSNAPAAIAFLLAYQITGKQEYLDFAQEIYDFMNRTMRYDDLFIDNLALDGSVGNYWKGAYNQATMIYAGSLLYEITGDKAYYDLTKATVNASLTHMFRQVETADGPKVQMNVNPIFKAWCIGWLARSYVKFYEIDPERDGAAMDLLTSVVRDELATKDKNGLYDPFFCSGGKDRENYTELLAQCGVACTMLNTAYYDAILK